MKKIITVICMALFVSALVSAQDLYVRFNTVPKNSEILKAESQGNVSGSDLTPVPVTFEGGVATDAYKMTVPSAGDSIYTLNLTLPVGNYQYRVVFADGTGNQIEHNLYYKGGKPFTISGESQNIVFRAKIYNDGANNYIKHLCDAQPLYISFTTGHSATNPLFYDSDPNGIATLFYDGNSYETTTPKFYLYPGSSTIYIADLLPITTSFAPDNTAGGRVRWKLTYNRHTLSLGAAQKVVTLLENNLLKIGGGEFITASSIGEDLGTFTTNDPLLLAGGTSSLSARIVGTISGGNNSAILGDARSDSDWLKIAPKNIVAKMYYNIYTAADSILVTSSEALLNTGSELETPELSTDWTLETAIDITNTLPNNNYILNAWYETECFGDTQQSTVYTTSFTVNNTPTGIDVPSVNTVILTTTNAVNALFEGSAEVKLYSISGQLIDQTVAVSNYTKTVNKGAYILLVAGKTYKVLVK